MQVKYKFEMYFAGHIQIEIYFAGHIQIEIYFAGHIQIEIYFAGHIQIEIYFAGHIQIEIYFAGHIQIEIYFAGHIQIAQAPDRSEPDLNGEINYKYILQLLEDIGYDGFIGLEYKPRGKNTGLAP